MPTVITTSVHPHTVVFNNLRAASDAIGAVSSKLDAVRYGQAEAGLGAAAAARSAVESAYVGFVHVTGKDVDYRDGVWSDTAGQGDAAQAARLLSRTNGIVSGLHRTLTDVATVKDDRAGTTPVYNDLGDGGMKFADYWRPALEVSRRDVAKALEVLGKSLPQG